MIKELTSYQRMCELAELDELTTKQIAEVASVGINKGIILKEEITRWMIQTGKYRVVNKFRLSTKAVFEFLTKDINDYKGGH